MSRVDAWAGNINRLADVPAVKRAKKIGGVVLASSVEEPLPDEDEVQFGRLKALLDKVTKDREEKLNGIRGLVGRIGLLKRAERRADARDGVCGFDARVCWDEREWNSWLENGGREIIEDDDDNEEEGTWWCTGKRKCDRHAG